MSAITEATLTLAPHEGVHAGLAPGGYYVLTLGAIRVQLAEDKAEVLAASITQQARMRDLEVTT